MILFDNHRPSFSLDMMSLVDLNWVSLQHVSPLFVSTFYMSPGRFQFFWSTFFWSLTVTCLTVFRDIQQRQDITIQFSLSKLTLALNWFLCHAFHSWMLDQGIDQLATISLALYLWLCWCTMATVLFMCFVPCHTALCCFFKLHTYYPLNCSCFRDVIICNGLGWNFWTI